MGWQLQIIVTVDLRANKLTVIVPFIGTHER